MFQYFYYTIADKIIISIIITIIFFLLITIKIKFLINLNMSTISTFINLPLLSPSPSPLAILTLLLLGITKIDNNMFSWFLFVLFSMEVTEALLHPLDIKIVFISFRFWGLSKICDYLLRIMVKAIVISVSFHVTLLF